VKLTGCTVFLVDGGVDAGPIVAQWAVPVLDADSVESLHERIKVAERALLVEVVTALTGSTYRVSGRRVNVG
jgi:phosphoribosylglycinamide formyltransferase-1